METSRRHAGTTGLNALTADGSGAQPTRLQRDESKFVMELGHASIDIERVQPIGIRVPSLRKAQSILWKAPR